MTRTAAQRRSNVRFAAWVAAASCLVPAAAWAGSTVTGRNVVAPAPAGAELLPDRPTAGHVAPTPLPAERGRPGWLLMNAAERPAAVAPPTAAVEGNDAHRGPQVVPLPPTFYPGLVLIGLAFLRVRKG